MTESKQIAAISALTNELAFNSPLNCIAAFKLSEKCWSGRGTRLLKSYYQLGKFDTVTHVEMFIIDHDGYIRRLGTFHTHEDERNMNKH